MKWVDQIVDPVNRGGKENLGAAALYGRIAQPPRHQNRKAAAGHTNQDRYQEQPKIVVLCYAVNDPVHQALKVNIT